MDPVNAMLNYGYGILAHRLRAQVIAAGLDPTIGIIRQRSQVDLLGNRGKAGRGVAGLVGEWETNVVVS